MKKTSIGAAVAGAVLCVLALAGCRGDGGSASGGQGGAATVSGAAVAVAATSSAAGASGASSQSPMTGTTTATGGGNPGDGVPSATPTGAAAVDSELDTVNQQLGTAGSDLAQATASPSDGG